MNRKSDPGIDAARAASASADAPSAHADQSVPYPDDAMESQSDAQTVEIYRVIDASQTLAPFDGSSGDAGGRWTSPGTPGIYASFSAAAALLEFVAHLEEGWQARDLLMAVARLSRHDIETPAELPAEWKERPYRESVRRIGDEWSRSCRSLALRVPSALCPTECNLILNPRHPKFARLRTAQLLPLQLDIRLRF